MKKLALAAIAVAAFGLGHAPVSAQESDDIPVECAEEDVVTDECAEFYVGIEPQPPSTPATTDAVAGVTTSDELPRTGGGVSPVLGIGGLLFVGGGIIVVASRRRNSSAPSAA